MARQDLAYQIAVNDAELRLATQHVAAFNAELEASTVTGKKLDTQLRSVGRRASQVGNFFIRNLTIPLGLAGAAAAKNAAQFDQAIAKIGGLAGASEAEVKRFRAAAISLSGHELTQGPVKLANALFFLRSVGLSANQSIAALKPISEAASAGLGDIGKVAEAVTSAMDAYGFSNLKANQATAALIQGVTKGKIPPEQLAAAIGRVIPIANAMGISFDQVIASIASLTRQGLNASLAVTGLRAILSTVIKPSNQTKDALASIGTSADAVALSFKKIGVFPTLLALRKEIGGLHVDTKTLTDGFNGNALALAKIKAAVGEGNQALGKLFPNVRALTAFLILTGPRKGANAGIFDSLAQSMTHADAVIKHAFSEQATTPIGRLNAQISELKSNTIGIGDGFLNAGSKVLKFVNGILSFIHGAGPTTKKLLKDFGIALLLLGPGIALFGRLTQAASFGVTVFGRWQERAQLAAQGIAGINIAQDKATIAQRKATTVFTESLGQITAAATKTSEAINRIGLASGAAATRAAKAAQTSAFIASGGAPRVGAGVIGVPPIATSTSRANVEDQISKLQVRRAAQAVTAQEALTAASAATIAAQTKLDIAVASGAAGFAKEAAAELASARASEQNAAAKLAEANVLRTLLFEDAQLVKLQRELVIAQENQIRFAAASAPISERQAAAQVASLEQQLSLRQRILAGQQLSQAESARLGGLGGTGSFAAMDARAQKIQAAAASSAIVTQGRIARTGWGTSMEGIKSAGKLGFDFIALTAGIDLATKVVGSSGKMKTAVTHDLFDINKAGVGALAGLASAALILGPKLGGGLAGLRGGASVFETLGLATLGWRAKLGLTLVSIIGLQKAGVNLETIFDAAAAGMLAKTVALRLGIVEAGAAFGPWGIAIGIAASVIAAKSGAITAVAGKISSFFGQKQLQTFGVAGVDATFKMIKGLQQATSEAQKRAIVEAVIAKSTASSADKAKFVAEFLGQAAASELVATAALHKNLEDTISGFDKLPPKIKAAVKELVKAGKPQAAQDLAQAAQIRVEQAQIRAAQKLLIAEGKKGIADLLGATANAVKDSQSKITDIFKAVQGQIVTAFDNHTARMLDSFDQQTSAILDQFDRQTSKLEDNLKAKVSVKGLNETFTVTVNGKTPAERELEALDRLAEKRNFQRDILSGKQALSTAQQLGDPVAVQKALQQVQDAETERRRFILEGRAKTERTAADAALKTDKQALDDRRAKQRQGIENSRAAARRDLEAARAVEESQIKSALAAQLRLFKEGKIGIGKFYTDILGIMQSHNVSLQQAGADGGAAYTKAFGFALKRLKGLVSSTLADITKTTAKGTATVKKNLGFLQAVLGDPNNPLSTAHALQNLTPQGIAAADAAANTTVGVPTRGAIIKAINSQLAGTAAHTYIGDVPKAGHPTVTEYQAFLNKVDPSSRTLIENRLRKQGFFRAAKGGVVPGPPWHAEGPAYYDSAYRFFHRYAKRGPYNTRLSAVEESRFRSWVESNGVPFDPNAKRSDYDMRGYWRATHGRGWHHGDHFPDTWKTPFDTTFSRESLYATKNNPFDWRGNDLVNTINGRVIFSPLASGGRVPGSGTGDSVPAMLTPGEIVLNRNQQRSLGGMLGVEGAGPHALFNLINARRFADGGVVGDDTLDRLLRALARNAQRRSSQFNAGLSGTPTRGTIAGRNTSGAGFVRNLVPTNITSLVTHGTSGLSRLQKISLEASLAQAQAHPLASGLLRVTPTGTLIGTHPTAVRGTGQLSGSSLDQPIVIHGDLVVKVDSKGGQIDVDRFLGDVRKIVKRSPRVRAVRPLAGRIGLG